MCFCDLQRLGAIIFGCIGSACEPVDSLAALSKKRLGENHDAHHKISHRWFVRARVIITTYIRGSTPCFLAPCRLVQQGRVVP